MISFWELSFSYCIVSNQYWIISYCFFVSILWSRPSLLPTALLSTHPLSKTCLKQKFRWIISKIFTLFSLKFVIQSIFMVCWILVEWLHSQKCPTIFQGTLKGEVSLYRWPPVWPVRISLFCKQKQKLSIVIQLIPNLSNKRSTAECYFPL